MMKIVKVLLIYSKIIWEYVIVPNDSVTSNVLTVLILDNIGSFGVHLIRAKTKRGLEDTSGEFIPSLHPFTKTDAITKLRSCVWMLIGCSNYIKYCKHHPEFFSGWRVSTLTPQGQSLFLEVERIDNQRRVFGRVVFHAVDRGREAFLFLDRCLFDFDDGITDHPSLPLCLMKIVCLGLFTYK